MQRLATTIAIIGAALIALAAAAAAQSPAPPQNQSIVETQWTGRPSSSDSPDLEGGAWTLYFRSDGVLVYSAGGASYDNAHWRQRDALVMRPIGLLMTVVGTAVYLVPVAPIVALTRPTDIAKPIPYLIGAPARFTFKDPLGYHPQPE